MKQLLHENVLFMTNKMYIEMKMNDFPFDRGKLYIKGDILEFKGYDHHRYTIQISSTRLKHERNRFNVIFAYFVVAFSLIFVSMLLGGNFIFSAYNAIISALIIAGLFLFIWKVRKQKGLAIIETNGVRIDGSHTRIYLLGARGDFASNDETSWLFIRMNERLERLRILETNKS